MDNEVLKTALERYKRYRATKEYKQDKKKWYGTISSFQSKFPIRQIETLTMDEYVEGKKSYDSFCYWIEEKTKSIASIKGARVDKFGVWFNKRKQGYDYVGRYGSSPEGALGKIKTLIIDLIDAGRSEDFTRIERNELSPMVKGKILSLYYPDKYLSVVSEKAVSAFLEILDNQDYSSRPLYEKKEKLRNTAQTNPLLLSYESDKWDTFAFYRFLYPYLNDERVDSPTGRAIPQNLTNQERKIKRATIPDRELGAMGENFIIEQEKQKLKNCRDTSIKRLVKKVKKAAYASGYDIESFDENGERLHIEVKTTSGNLEETFYITKNEYEQSESDSAFRIYRVFKFNKKTKRGNVQIFTGSFRSNFTMEPYVYRTTL